MEADFAREKREANPEIIRFSDEWKAYNNNLLYNNSKVNKKQDKNTKILFIVEKRTMSVINNNDGIVFL